MESISSGSVTSPDGFQAGATHAGIKEKNENALDLGILFSEEVCTTAGVFTTNRIKSAPVILSQRRLHSGKAVALVVNSGCANAFTGEQGLANASEMASLAAKNTGTSPKDVLIASTGVIGRQLPMERIRAGIERIVLTRDGGHDLAKAIMTTDTVPKEAAIKITTEETTFTVAGVAKGAGMIHPNMATMLCFLTTDAVVDLSFLRCALQKAVDISFNMISIDGDTSPNDTVVIMANGRAGNKKFEKSNGLADAFQQALNEVCLYLAKSIARDGEGASKLIEVTVSEAANEMEARIAARAIVSSPLVKSAIHGNDPNWGRIVAAAGRSGAEVVESSIDLFMCDVCLVKSGRPLFVDPEVAIRAMDRGNVVINLRLNLGTASATAWGCDLSEEYVTVNSQYTT